MFGKLSNPYEEVVAKATDEKQTEVNWDILLTVWDKVAEDGEAGARNCVAALQKRLQHRSANVQLFSLTLASALISNCGPPLHREISGKAFTSTLVRLVNDRTTHDSVKKEILRLVEEWCAELKEGDQGEIWEGVREGLRGQNHKFPSDRPTTPPNQVRRNEDALRREEEEELQRALEESAKMADPRRGFVASQPPASATTTSTKALPLQPRERRVRAIYDFEGGQGPDELPFRRGEVIRVLETVYNDWWRGELRGREGIFPANRVEELPDAPLSQQAPAPTPSSTSDAEMEAELFAKSASIDKLLNLMRGAAQRGEDLRDNDELADRYNECMALAPKVVGLIRKYDQKQAELREMNDKFVKAKATYEQMSGYAAPQLHQATPAPHTNGYSTAPLPAHQPPHSQGYHPSSQQPPMPSDAQREHEERERREYEEKYRIYEQELAAYNAAQAALQQQYAQQQPVIGHTAHGPSSTAASDPAAQHWQQAAPPSVQPQPHSSQPVNVEPQWNGSAWIYPSTTAAPPSRSTSITSTGAAPQPHVQSTSTPPPQIQAQHPPPPTAASPVSSLRSNPHQIAESLSQLSLDSHPSTAVPASVARYQLQDGPTQVESAPTHEEAGHANLSAEDQAAAEAWAKYHREKAEYDAYMAQQGQIAGSRAGGAVSQ